MLAKGVAHLCMLFSLYFYGQPSAILAGDQLFVAINGRLWPFSGHVWRGTFAPQNAAIQPPLDYPSPIPRDPLTTQAKLDIRDHRILVFHAGATHAIFSMADLQLLELNDFGKQLCRQRGFRNQDEFLHKSNGGGSLLLFPPFRGRQPDVPVRYIRGIRNPESVYNETARYDVQIASDTTVRLFHAHNNKLFISLEYDYIGYSSESDDSLPTKQVLPANRNLRTGTLPEGFTERFATYTDSTKDRDYLVTDNGKVYMSVTKGMTAVEVTTVWNDPNRVIVGVVKDMTRGVVYGWGFVSDIASPDRFYVKFDPEPVAQPYKITVSQQFRRADAYLESYECARAFRHEINKK